MTKIPRKIVKYVLVAINAICVVGMWACAWTSYLEPQHYPRLSYWGLAFPIFLVPTVLFTIFWLCTRRRWALISIVGMLLCAGSVRTYYPINFPWEPPEGSLKVISYNINMMGRTDDGRDWKQAGVPWHETPIVQYLLTSEADIVCCQEASYLSDAQVDATLSETYPYRLQTSIHHSMYHVLSRHPIVDSGTINYPSSTNGSVYYHIAVGTDTILVINNHFESYKLDPTDREEYTNLIRQPDDGHARENFDSLSTKLATATAIRGVQADSVDRFIARSNAKYIIACGDFNDASISYVHYRMTRHLNDAYTRSGNGPGISYNRSGMYFRIDNILCSSNIRPYGAYVDTSIRTSDHYPICCWLKFK